MRRKHEIYKSGPMCILHRNCYHLLEVAGRKKMTSKLYVHGLAIKETGHVTLVCVEL